MSEKREWEIVEDFIHDNIRCLIAKLQIGERENSRASFGEEGFYQYNGYVIIPKGHRDYGVVDEYEYDFLENHLINKDDIAKYVEGKPTRYDVHGGITFRNWGSGIYPEGEWIIGFDTSHITDVECSAVGWKKGHGYVKRETQKLAEQVAKTEEGSE